MDLDPSVDFIPSHCIYHHGGLMNLSLMDLNRVGICGRSKGSIAIVKRQNLSQYNIEEVALFRIPERNRYYRRYLGGGM